MLNALRRWWQVRTGEEETPFDGDAPAWAVSLLVHLGLIVTLALFFIYRPDADLQLTLPSEDEELVEPMVQDFFAAKDAQTDIGANSVQGLSVAASLAPTISDISDVPMEVADDVNPTVNVQFNADIPTGLNFSDTQMVKGAVGVGTTGASGAIDRITQEILQSLQTRKTLVVWLFDQSGSLNRTRKEINDRFDRIYEELGVVKKSGHEAFAKHDDKPLLTAIASFGQKCNFLTKEPTDDLAEMKKAIDSIEDDPTGIENTFQSVMLSVDTFQKYRTQVPRRNVMFVVVTDEVGDDEQALDMCVAKCRRAEIPVYVIGVPAPFGRTELKIKYVDLDPNYDQSVQWIPVRQGPETVYPERLKLAFAGGRNDDLDELDSGFGPFALTRLCYETGGIYFAVHGNNTAAGRAVGRNETPVMAARIQHFFDPGIMRRYRPDYKPIEEYQKLVSQNGARRALIQAAQVSWVSPMENPTLQFPKQNEGALKALLDEAQKSAAKLEPKIEELYLILSQGEKDRPKVSEPRWQAGFDLAMGRVCAVKVRTESYNNMLAVMKGGRAFQNKDNDTWVLEPADNYSGSALEKLAEKAKVYLQRVVEEHPGTPWALIAERELQTPLGWDWKETRTGVNDPRPAMGNGNNNNNNNNPNGMMAKPKRPNVKL